MLPGAGGLAEPGVVGHVDDPGRPPADQPPAVADEAGEQALVADQRLDQAEARHEQRSWRRAGGKPVLAHMGQLLEAHRRQQLLGGQIFPEWNQAVLVVDTQQPELITLAAHRIKAVVEGRLHRPFVDPGRSDQQGLTRLQRLDDARIDPQIRVEQIVGVGGDRALGPDDDVRDFGRQGRRLASQGQVSAEDVVELGGVVLGLLTHVRLHHPHRESRRLPGVVRQMP